MCFCWVCDVVWIEPEAVHNTPKPSGSIYDPVLPLLWVYRRTLQCQALSRCWENTRQTRKVLLSRCQAILLHYHTMICGADHIWGCGVWVILWHRKFAVSFIYMPITAAFCIRLLLLFYFFFLISFLSFSCNAKVPLMQNADTWGMAALNFGNMPEIF